MGKVEGFLVHFFKIECEKIQNLFKLIGSFFATHEKLFIIKNQINFAFDCVS